MAQFAAGEIRLGYKKNPQKYFPTVRIAKKWIWLPKEAGDLNERIRQ